VAMCVLENDRPRRGLGLHRRRVAAISTTGLCAVGTGVSAGVILSGGPPSWRPWACRDGHSR
jgi:hypothetical protein